MYSAPLISIYAFYDSVSWFSVRYIIFTARNVNIDRERRNTYFPTYVAVIIQRWIYDWLPTARAHARKILSSSICLCESATVPSRPVLVWQQLFERLTSILKYMLDRYCRLPWELHARGISAHSRSLNIDDSPAPSSVLLCGWLWNFTSASFRKSVTILNFEQNFAR